MNRTRAYRRRQVRQANVILFLCGAVFGFLDLIPFSLLCIFGILGNILWIGTSLGEHPIHWCSAAGIRRNIICESIQKQRENLC